MDASAKLPPPPTLELRPVRTPILVCVAVVLTLLAELLGTRLGERPVDPFRMLPVFGLVLATAASHVQVVRRGCSANVVAGPPQSVPR